MIISKVWKYNQIDINSELIEAAYSNKILACLLKKRGIDTKEKIHKFLNPLKAPFISPDVFSDMEKTTARIKTAIENGENITVYGDFDADGVTSASILYLTLKKIGAKVDYYLPDRSTESHGLNTKALVNIISKRKSKLIITVDCGISNINEINFAKSFGTDVIITDHHEAPEILPDAFAVINPKAQNSLNPDLDMEELKSLSYLSGAGVAFKLACKLLQEYHFEDYVHQILPLAAIGTIGDIVELLGENRSISAMGIELLKQGIHKGINKLLFLSGITDLSQINSDTITYHIVPKLNAAGRLETPITALNLLISDDDGVLDESAKTLCDLNKLRQETCDEVFSEAKDMYEKNISENKNCIVLLSDNWHVGIIGIVASKLVEYYNKPAFLMTRDTNSPNIIRCSARSIEGINIHTVMTEIKENFEGFGGHKMAGGFSFDENKITFNSLKKLLCSKVDEYAKEVDFLKLEINADLEISPEDVTLENYKMIEKLEPFGAQNPPPIFVMNKLKLNMFKMMGQNNNHLKLFVSKDNSPILEAVKWNCPNFNLPVNSELDILFSLKLNNFNDKQFVQMMIQDIHSDLSEKMNNPSKIKILDHRNKKDILMQVIDFIFDTKKSTAIYIENPILFTRLKLPESLRDKVFSSENIPVNKEQIMFFDIPISADKFSNILRTTKAKIVHLMNFSKEDINVDSFILRLSGMLKYALSNMEGNVNIKRLSKALNVDEDTIECALNIFETSQMIDLNRKDDENYIISYLHPVEMSKIKNADMYSELETQINNIKSFKDFYLNSSVEEIKSFI